MYTYFQSIALAMLEIFILGLLGFMLVRRKIISEEGLSGLAAFLVGVSLPALMLGQIIRKFSFQLYPDWWLFFIMSVAVTSLGALLGRLFGASIKDAQTKREFLGLVAFQNSGYLPLTLLSGILPQGQLDVMLIYLFLFLLGFNFVIWSWGVFYLSQRKLKHFSLSSMFSPPVAATLLGFLIVFLKIDSLIPKFIFRPLEMLGECSFPLAMVVVGGSLASLYTPGLLDKKLALKLILAKLIILPLLGLLILSWVGLPYLVGLLVILELAVPSATSLALIVRKYVQKEGIITSGIFITHIVSIITLPLFLGLYNWIALRR